MNNSRNADDGTEEQPVNTPRTDGGVDESSSSGSALAQIVMNRRRVDIDNQRPMVREILTATKRTPPEHFDVYRLQNSGDTEGTQIQLSETIDRTSEQDTVFLRAVENNRNAGR